MTRACIWMLVCAALLLPRGVGAQTPVNPTAVEFEHTDFDTTNSYSVGYFSSATATAPVQEAVFPKPASCAPCAGPLPSRPTQFGTWYAAVRAIGVVNGQSVSSPWSNRVPFERTPSAPTVRSVR